MFNWWEGNDVWSELSEVRKIEGSRNPLYIRIHQTECVRIYADLSDRCSIADYTITDSSIFSQPEARAVSYFLLGFLFFQETGF